MINAFSGSSSLQSSQCGFQSKMSATQIFFFTKVASLNDDVRRGQTRHNQSSPDSADESDITDDGDAQEN